MDPTRPNVVLVVEVDDAWAEYGRLEGEGVRFLAEPYEPPWGGCRFFCVDPDGFLIEIEQPAGVGSTEPAESGGAGSAGAGATS